MKSSRKKSGKRIKKVTKRYKQKGGSDYAHKTPGPEQCHPRVGKSRPVEGCIPVDTLKKVATKLDIDANSPELRTQIETKLSVKPKHEYSFVKALPLSDSEKQKLIKEYLRPKMPELWNSMKKLILTSNLWDHIQ